MCVLHVNKAFAATQGVSLFVCASIKHNQSIRTPGFVSSLIRCSISLNPLYMHVHIKQSIRTLSLASSSLRSLTALVPFIVYAHKTKHSHPESRKLVLEVFDFLLQRRDCLRVRTWLLLLQGYTHTRGSAITYTQVCAGMCVSKILWANTCICAHHLRTCVIKANPHACWSGGACARTCMSE